MAAANIPENDKRNWSLKKEQGTAMADMNSRTQRNYNRDQKYKHPPQQRYGNW